MKELWIVIAEWDGDVRYGIDRASYILWIADSEEEAKIYCNSYACFEKMQKVVPSEPWFGANGDVEISYVKWSNGDRPLFCGGAWYME